MADPKEPSFLLVSSGRGPSISCFSRRVSLPSLPVRSVRSTALAVSRSSGHHGSQLVRSESPVPSHSVPGDLGRGKSAQGPVLLPRAFCEGERDGCRHLRELKHKSLSQVVDLWLRLGQSQRWSHVAGCCSVTGGVAADGECPCPLSWGELWFCAVPEGAVADERGGGSREPLEFFDRF